MSNVLKICGLSRRVVFCQAAKKGNVKVNDRGKVSSRPGPISPKEAKRQAEEAKKAAQLQQQPQIQQQSTEKAASPSASTPTQTSTPAPQPPSAPAPVNRGAPIETPQVVVDRIFSRMITCAAVPLVVGISLLVVIFFLKKQGGDDFPMWPAYLSQGFTLMGGLLGISYGALSASWDPNREGSALGWTEFRANLPIFLNRDKQA